jgi:tRNA(Ile)-lysidine synthetase-like protein
MSSIERRVLDKVTRALRGYRLDSSSRILVGFSGGPDSTALVHALSMLSSTHGYVLKCIYLDHGLRPPVEGAAEESHIRTQCSILDIPVAVRRIPRGMVRDAACARGRGIEEAARFYRYAVFTEMADEWRADCIAVGHNADDQTETLIMRFFQGAGPWGMAGIPARRDRIVRPLITVSRREILDFLRVRGVPYSTDSSNLEPEFLRNRVRHRLRPQIREIFPGFEDSLGTFAENAAFAEEFIREEAGRRLRWIDGESSSSIEVDTFYMAPPVLRIWSLYRLFGRWRGLDSGNDVIDDRIPYALIRETALHRPPDPEAVIARAFGRRLIRHGDRLFWEPDVVVSLKKGYLYVIETEGRFRAGGVVFSVHPNADVSLNAGTACVSRLPVVIRTRRPGDRMRTSAGNKSLKKLFNEWSVSHTDRESIPIIQDRYGLRAVVGSGLGYPDVTVHDNSASRSSGIRAEMEIDTERIVRIGW